MARDLSSQGGDRDRSLLDLLDGIGKPSTDAPPSPGTTTQPPPAHVAWQSPLRRQCAAPQTTQRQQLLSLVSQLRTAPRQVSIDPTNFGERFSRDAFGNPLDPTPRLVVLHETVYSLESAISTFRTPHPRDEDQVSYHALVGRDGEVVFLLDPRKRAFGAGNSAFRGQWAITNPKVGGSVNNFALHVSLESPRDGEDGGPNHSGYTTAQYDGLAALLALWMQTFPIAADQITTHRAVDLGGERADPRSFDWSALQSRLGQLGLLC
ncbi:MAG: N-acetylmuramoyl-L-alanine amidase [Cyanobium sp. M30B3]|nr:MAG: N-acetylmuramoyl-L-alanine amidase [Cyanobium sp. M30B3]